MKKLFTLAFAVLASFSLWAYTAPADGTYDLTVEANAKVSSSGRFIVVSEGLYAYRLGSGYSYSGGNGLKTQSNQGGFVFYLDIDTKVTCTIKHTESKNAHDVSINLYSISEAQYKEFDDNKAASTKSQTLSLTGLTPATFTIAVAAEAKEFEGEQVLKAGYYALVPTGEKSNTYLSALSFAVDCTAPATPLSLKIDQTTTIYEGDVFNISTEGGNGNTEIKLKLDGIDYKNWYWGAAKGEHTFTAYQEKNGEYCGQEAELKLTVLEKNPVTAVIVSGPKTGYVGMPMTFTVTAENATEYRWLVNGSSVPGETGTTFTYTPTAPTASATDLSIRCDARNEFNGYSSGYEAWKSSELYFVEVSILSGAILEFKAETGSSNIDKDVVAGGIIGGTVHQKTQKNAKLGSNGHYISLQLTNGSFFADDTVKVIVLPEYNSDKDLYSAPATLKLASDKDNTDFIGEANLIVDPASADPIYVAIPITKDVETIYLSRTSSFSQNPIVDSIVVIRPVDDGSPVLKVNKTSVNVSVTAESPTTTAKFSYTGKHLTPGTYSINTGDFPASAFWSYSPKSVTVGADGKLNEEISVTFNGEGGSGSTIPEYLSITFGLAINSKSVSTLVVCDFDMEKDYINASVNIEQLILDHGKNYDIVKDLMSAEINYLKIDALDSLSDKSDRNEPYLGLKLQKATDAMIGGWVKKDDVLRVKFGNIPDAVLVTINDAAPVEWTNHEYEFTATEDSYIKFAPKGTGSKLVVKQIMLNEPIAAVTLPDDPTAIDNTEMDAKVVKTFENGQLVIIKNGVKYNATGSVIR